MSDKALKTTNFIKSSSLSTITELLLTHNFKSSPFRSILCNEIQVSINPFFWYSLKFEDYGGRHLCDWVWAYPIALAMKYHL